MRRHAARAARVLLLATIIVALILFARTVNWGDSLRAVSAASPGLIFAAALANLVSIAIKGVRWWIFLRPIGVQSLGLAIRAAFAGAALNNVLIANSGEAARVVMVARAANVPSARVLATLALERFFESFGFVVLLAGAVTFMDLPPMLAALRPVAIIVLVAMLALLVYLARHPERAEQPVAEAHGFRHRARQFMHHFLRTLTRVSSGKRFAAAVVVTLVVWALQFASYHLTAMAVSFPIRPEGTLAAMLAVNLSFAIRATPGNVGVFQAMYALMAVAFGLDKDAAIGVGLLIQTQQLIPATLLGLAAAPQMLRRTSVTPATATGA
jgi:uncharacterized protein (TIRG00374 family)